jgi:peptide/nickel transport system permease protein
VVILAITTITFFLTHVIPGDPVTAMVGDYPVPASYVAQVRALFGLNQSLPVQFVLYLEQLVQGNLGFSFASQQAVLPLVMARGGYTLILMLPALVIASALGVLGAVAAARNAGRPADAWIAGASLFGYSVPVFWLGQILIVVFAVSLGWLPAQGMLSPFGDTGQMNQAIDILSHAILPMFCLVIYYIALVARVGRSSLLDALQQDYVLTARAKGLSMRRVMWTHALPGAMGPILTVIGYQFGYALTGAILVETVFGWPGIGTLFVSAISQRDYPVLEGIFILSAISVVLANLVTDLVHALLDPRVREAQTSHA